MDAQLPRRLAHRLRAAGHDTLHTLDLPDRNRTTDRDIVALAEREARVVVTKDADFVNSFLLFRQPPKLLLISTGNISNDELDALFTSQLGRLSAFLLANDFVELNRTSLIVHM